MRKTSLQVTAFRQKINFSVFSVMKTQLSRFLFALAALIFINAAALAQIRTDTFAITGARIVTVSGAPIERGIIVVRNGLIEAVGADAKIPPDARMIDGAGLTVYPGFFDAYTNLGLQTAQQLPQGQRQAGAFQIQQASAPATNSNFPNGLQPETKALEQLKAGDAQFEASRNAGVTTALTVGREGIFNGQSALINLSGETVSGMIVREPVAQHVTFRTLGFTYPTALLGTFSALRQMFLDAQRLQAIQKMYAENPRGMQRPDADASLEALIPVLNRQMPVVFNANTEREIVRVLDLAQEFNLLAMISGGQEAWKVADRLKKQGVPVLLSLNFPKRTTANSPDADPETLETLRLRVETPKGAARLQQAGVKFAFQSGGMSNLQDFSANAGRAVENGLDRDAAVRAMTLSAAEIFGVDNRLGSIERGKIANLVVSRGDILSRDKTITHVFVDGKLFEQKPAPPRRTTNTENGATPAFVNVNGAWNITIEIPNQAVQATLNLVQDGKNLSGSVQLPSNTVQIKDGEVTSDGLRFKITAEFSGKTEEIVVNARVSGNQMNGTVATTQGAIPFSGTRNP